MNSAEKATQEVLKFSSVPTEGPFSSNLIYQGCKFCNDVEGWKLISENTGFLSPCSVDLIAIFIPSVILILAVSAQIWVFNKRNRGNVKYYWGFWLKISLVSLQMLMSAVLFVFSYSLFYFNDIRFISSGFLTVGLGLALCLHVLEQSTSRVPSGVLLIYWVLAIFFNITKTYVQYDRGMFLMASDQFAYSVFWFFMTINSVMIFTAHLLVAKPLRGLHFALEEEKVSPIDRANIFQRLTFSWLNTLIIQGYTRKVTEEDLPELSKGFNTNEISETFQNNWKIEGLRAKLSNNDDVTPSLIRVLYKSFGSYFILACIFELIYDLMAFIQPQLLRLLIRFVSSYANDTPQPLIIGVSVAFSMFSVTVMRTTIFNSYFINSLECGLRIKSGLTSSIFAKTLSISSEERSKRSTGEIMNIMTVDVQKIQNSVDVVPTLWIAPIQILLCLYSLYGFVGYSMWAGFAFMVVMIPINAVLARKQKKMRKKQMEYKDTRTRLTTEILSNVKSLKLYNWEDALLARLDHARNECELKNLQRISIFISALNFLWSCTPFFVSCSTFAVFVMTQDKPLSTDIVFPALSLFNLLSNPLTAIPMAITSLLDSSVSFTRLEKLLSSDELQEDAVVYCPKQEVLGRPAVEITGNATFLFEKPPKSTVALKDINFVARKGELTCIVGKVGTGKSSFLQAILGDIYRLNGEVTVRGSVAYVAQVPWIMNATVKENILFGKRFDANFYEETIHACALTDDLAVLPDGDSSMVGEKGISLSGGQKARLALARAVYARADIYVLDDPLSAVDEHVGKHIIKHVLSDGGLLQTKTRILATNSISVLSKSKNISMLSDLTIVETSSFEDIMRMKDSALYSLIVEFGRHSHEDNIMLDDSDAGCSTSSGEASTLVQSPLSELSEHCSVDEDVLEEADLDLKKQLSGTSSLRRASTASFKNFTTIDYNALPNDTRTKQKEEFSEQGKVKWSVYREYIEACSLRGVISFFVLLVSSAGLNVAGNIWLKHWSEINSDNGSNPNIKLYLGVYFLLGVSASLFTVLRTITLWCLCSIRSSKILHNRMIKSVLRSPMSYFETTPLGRIINRFTSDMNLVDEALPRVFSLFFNMSVKLLFTLMVIIYSTYQVIFILLPLSCLYIYYQQYYIRISRDLKRLNNVSRSPIYAHFQETLNGLSTIRAYNLCQRFQFMNSYKVDFNLKSLYNFKGVNRWLVVRLQFIGSLILLTTASLIILSTTSTVINGPDKSKITPGVVGLVMSYTLEISDFLTWLVRASVEVETNIVAVERVLEYCRLPSEAAEIVETNRPNGESGVPGSSWPLQGRIEFRDYSTRYRDNLDLVLKSINLTIAPREKIGIVGRTGAGKSSLTLALFRIIEATSGQILIDDVDIGTIGLKDLRANLSIIPQDSQIFEGTIRQNLDPVGQFSDDKLWHVLELSHLKAHVERMFEQQRESETGVSSEEGGSSSDGGGGRRRGKSNMTKCNKPLESGLDCRVAESGSNLSAGQRQLMCLGRALLTSSPILILDEATAAVDVETDQIIQTTIHNQFQDRTILVIAHRLNTIINSDKIIVLDKGEVAEFDTPANLLKIGPEGLFYSLCLQGGFIDEKTGTLKEVVTN